MHRHSLDWGYRTPGPGCCGCAAGCLGYATVALLLLTVFVACTPSLGGEASPRTLAADPSLEVEASTAGVGRAARQAQPTGFQALHAVPRPLTVPSRADTPAVSWEVTSSA